jgi:hypothetical protein
MMKASIVAKSGGTLDRRQRGPLNDEVLCLGIEGFPVLRTLSIKL